MFPAENKNKPAPGRLLIAEPFLSEAHFRRSVILLAEHNNQGTIGFVLNKPIELKMHEVVPDFPESDIQVYFGGPVQRDQLFYVHRLGNLVEDSLEIAPGLWWLGDFERLCELVKQGKAGPDDVRFFVGYAGWEPEQLLTELEGKSWFVTPTRQELTFSHTPEKLWEQAVQSMGKSYTVMLNYPEDPSLN